MLCALDFFLAPAREIAVAGEPRDPKSRELLKQIFTRYLPNKVVVCGTDDRLALLKERPRINGQATAYVATIPFACRPSRNPRSLQNCYNSKHKLQGDLKPARDTCHGSDSAETLQIMQTGVGCPELGVV